MTVMELLRNATEGRGSSGPASGRSWRALLAGAGTAALSALTVVLPALLVWVASPQSTVEWTVAAGVGASGWLLAGGGHLRAGSGAVSLVPLLALTGVLALAVVGARRTIRGTATPAPGPGGDRRWGLVPQPTVRPLLAWTAGYAACALLWGALAFAGPAPPSLATLAWPVLVVPLLAAILAGRSVRATGQAQSRPESGSAGGSEGRSEGGSEGGSEGAPPGGFARRSWPDRLPVRLAVQRALPGALWGMAAMLGAGAVIVLLLVLARFGAVSQLQSALGPGLVGGAVLVLVQLLVLPNLALWAVSFCAGSGFAVVAGAPTDWSGSRSGLLPMVPVLGALPPPGAFPWAVALVVLLPVAVGGLVGWRCLRGVARLSAMRTKALVVATGEALAAGGLGLLDVVGGGSLGAERLTHTGAPAVWMSALLLVEFGIGGAALLAWHRWRLRR